MGQWNGKIASQINKQTTKQNLQHLRSSRICLISSMDRPGESFKLLIRNYSIEIAYRT